MEHAATGQDDRECICVGGDPQSLLEREELEQEASLLRALADPTRLGILKLLAASDRPVCVCELVDRFPLGQPTISHHLGVLRKAGLVSAYRQGTWMYYQIQRSRVRDALACLGELVSVDE
ncbi:transcriptional regulator, ArsR family [Thermobaculum terrenum ATCC BAA-798]|uniref:Transcriptional regulator, ArsR family n=1 Tax=Thermobaculum terrenum (strain ATCC BAA-798 / CCMEE 7001 / YNP1) TaxID=525904 RepID=D1CII7_THET1|nr:metalloregulator ArsR/SmtB family transcription factor [Thermobaculum terrenum]ACZ43558.1 transcriptional regulator, ArsR family [Thermobaculum terrenum ATCC BAA-798]